MAASLSSRLKRLRETRAATSPLPELAIESAESDHPEFLALWERIAPHAYRRSVTRALDNLPSVLDADPFVARLASRYSLPAILERRETRLPCDVRELRFFDLETTGLSGGAGTIAFLATVARPSEGSLLFEQFFLSDYPGEASYLRAVLSALGPAPLLVTHNGKAFDVPLLRTRCLMQGLRFPEPCLHLDFLMTARRLWRSMLGGASLGILERGVLGLERSGDVPGQDIPGIWLASLRSGFHPLLPQVITHNLLDVENLAALLARANQVFTHPRDFADGSSVDRYSLARILVASGRAGEGETLLQAAAAEGDPRSALFLSRLLRAMHRGREARNLLVGLEGSWALRMESSNIAEKEEGDLSVALSSASEAVALATTRSQRESAESRVRRLELRVAKALSLRPGRRRS
jgi:uncharacterized protein YprB with RNaseH-like and TPR domain